MIKRLKPVLILSGVLAVLLIVLVILMTLAPEAEETEGEGEEKTIHLLDTDLSNDPEDRSGVELDEADSIKIENEFDTYTLVKKAIGTYYMQGKKDLNVNSDSVVTLLDSIGALGINDTVEEDEIKDLKNYGLDKPSAKVTVKDGKNTYVLTVGDAYETNYYAQLEGDPNVYLIGNAVPDIVMLSRYQFYSDTMVEYSDSTEDQETLKKFVVGGSERDEEIVIVMNELEEDEVGAAYMITEPFGHPFSSTMQENLQALISALSTCGIAGDDVTPAGLAKFGLDKPSYYMSFTMKGKTQKVWFGDVSDAGYRYCYAEGGDFVHHVSESDADVLYAPLKDYCEDMIYTNAYDLMESIKITGKGKTYQVSVGVVDDDGNFTVSINNKVVSSDLFNDFYAHLLMIGITDLHESGASGSPYLSVELKLRGGNTDIIRFYEVGENKCFCEVNGGGYFLVKTHNVEKLLENAQKLYDGETINLEW